MLKKLLLVLSLVGCNKGVETVINTPQVAPAAPVEVVPVPVVIEVKKEPTQEDLDQDLGNFIYTLMDIVKAELSDTKKKITTRTIIRVVNDILVTKEQKQHFAVLLAIESRFNNKAKSPVGATGISQLMPKYSHEFAAKCQMDDFKIEDIHDLEINLYLGACQFRSLLESPRINGNVALALVSYNAGMHSKAFQEIIGLRNITNMETSNYVAKFTFLREKAHKTVRDQKEEAKKIEDAKTSQKIEVKDTSSVAAKK